jgi:hypothetical protein
MAAHHLQEHTESNVIEQQGRTKPLTYDHGIPTIGHR